MEILAEDFKLYPNPTDEIDVCDRMWVRERKTLPWTRSLDGRNFRKLSILAGDTLDMTTHRVKTKRGGPNLHLFNFPRFGKSRRCASREESKKMSQNVPFVTRHSCRRNFLAPSSSPRFSFWGKISLVQIVITRFWKWHDLHIFPRITTFSRYGRRNQNLLLFFVTMWLISPVNSNEKRKAFLVAIIRFYVRNNSIPGMDGRLI